jgi:dTDP-4-dehydrorhamnose reductase
VRELSIMRIVVTGASGQLGAYLVPALRAAGHHSLFPWSRCGGGATTAVDLSDANNVAAALGSHDPDLIIHAAARSRAEEVRREPRHAWAVNVESTRQLARWCLERGRRLIFTSTDMVFDGTRGWYREDDPPRPILEYGRTKAAAEESVLEVPGGLVARISLLYGPSKAGRPSFFDSALSRLRAGEPQVFFADEYRTPLHYAKAAEALILLAEREARGIVHVAGRERVSRHELMLRVADALALGSGLIHANRREDVPAAEPRPADVSLDTTRLTELLPDLDRPAIETAIYGLTD